MTIRVINADVLDGLRQLPDESVHCVVTSPPYWGLRDYGVDGQIGLERTPQEFIAKLVEVFREVRRVLRKDGTCWVNLGDSYATSGGPGWQGKNGQRADRRFTAPSLKPEASDVGLKPKDLVGIPWRFAFAMQDDGWVLRQEIIWAKPNPMPESVTDRCTKAHESLFLFAKASKSKGIECAPITDGDAKWLAAIVDGEGSICFQNKANDGFATTWSVRLSIVNTHKGLLERVAEICGVGGGPGAPSPRHRSTGESGRPVYSWQITNAKAAAVIAAIRPHLIVKGAQADLALSVQQLNAQHKGRGGYVTTPEDTEYKEWAAAACSALNRGDDVDLSRLRAPRVSVWNGCEKYYFDAEAIKEPATSAGASVKMADGWAVGPGAHGSIHKDGRSKGASNGFVQPDNRNRRSVWSIATAPFSEAHFATFPPELPELCIKAGCPKGGTVLDPFGGAGTTGMVADRLQRNAILIELNPEYAAMAERRVSRDRGALLDLMEAS